MFVHRKRSLVRAATGTGYGSRQRSSLHNPSHRVVPIEKARMNITGNLDCINCTSLGSTPAVSAQDR